MHHIHISLRRVLPPGEYDRRAMPPVAKLLRTLFVVMRHVAVCGVLCETAFVESVLLHDCFS